MPKTKSVWKWLFGAVLLIAPYGYLSGGSAWDYWFALVFVPLASLILYGIFTPSVKEAASEPNHECPKWGDSSFWLFVAYFCLPPIMNGLSKLLWFLAFEKAGYWVFEFRHWSMVLVVMIATFTGWIIEACVKSVVDSSD